MTGCCGCGSTAGWSPTGPTLFIGSVMTCRWLGLCSARFSAATTRPGHRLGRRQPSSVIFSFSAAPRRNKAVRRNRALYTDELAGVHEVAGIEGALDRAHQVDLDGRFVMGDLVALEAADAVLGADRPV